MCYVAFVWLFVLIFNIKFTPNCVTVTPEMYIINAECVRVRNTSFRKTFLKF